MIPMEFMAPVMSVPLSLLRTEQEMAAIHGKAANRNTPPMEAAE